MDDCFGDTAIDEDQIVFDFDGEGDFELRRSEAQDSLRSTTSDFLPTIDFEGVPELHQWSDPPGDEELKIETGHGFDLQGRDIERSHLENDSSQVLSTGEHNRNLLSQDDVIVSNAGPSQTTLVTRDLLSSNATTSHLENNDSFNFSFDHLSTLSTADSHSADAFQSSDSVPLSSSSAFPPESSPLCPPVSIPPAFPPVSSPPPFPPTSIAPVPPVSILPAFPPPSIPQHPPVSSPPAFPPPSIPQHPLVSSSHLTRLNEPADSSSPSVQFKKHHSSPPSETLSIIQLFSSSNSSPPTANPFRQPVSSSPPPHLLSNDDDDDDEFDFDELVASRTHFKLPTQQTSAKVEVPKEKKIEFPPEEQFDVDFDLKMEEIETKLTEEDNGITALAPGQRSEEAFDEASDEWDRVQTIEPGFEDGQTRTPKERVGTEPITFAEAVMVLDRSRLMQQFGTSIKTSVVRGALASIFHRLCGGPRLHQRLHSERDFAFCLASCPFNNEDSIHCRVLFSIYKQLTGSRFDCPRFGSHWEIIGFQGQDPSTDLRGAGFFALLQLLHLVTDLKTQSLARSLYRLSLHETQNFPFSVMGINLTRMTIAAMREDCLNKECNRRGQLLGVLNDFYIGLFHRFQVIWKTQRKTIRDTGFVLADLESYAKKHPQEMVRAIVQIQSTADAAPSQHLDGARREMAHIDEHLF